MLILTSLIYHGSLAAAAMGLLYTGTVAAAALSAILAPTSQRRRAALDVLKVLLKRNTGR